MKHVILNIVLVVLCSYQGIAQSDSLLSSAPWYGSVVQTSSDTSATITKQQRRQVLYHTLGELLVRSSMFQPLSQGGFGQFDGLSIAGGMLTDIAFTFNGRPLRTAWNNTMNLSTIAPEGIERIEVLTGSAAIGLSSTLSQTAINLQEVRYDTRTPYTALWYSQGGGDVIAADAAIAQNIAPGVNVNLGVRRNGANGRYARTDFDVWNVRAGLRYAVDTLTTMGFIYQLTSHNTDLWGGVKSVATLDSFTEETAPVMYADLRDHQRRHDFSVGYDRLLTSDSSHSLSASMYYVLDGMFRIRDLELAEQFGDTNSMVQFGSSVGGLFVRTRHRMGSTLLRLGVGAEYVNSDSTDYTQPLNEIQPRVFAHVHQQLTDNVSVQAAGYVGSAMSRLEYGAGGGVTYQSGLSRLRIDASMTQRSPSPAIGSQLQSERTLLCLGEYSYVGPSLSLSGQAFYRQTSRPYLFYADTNANGMIVNMSGVNGLMWDVVGFVARGQYTHQWFETSITVRGHRQLSGDPALPPIAADFSLNGLYQLQKNSIRLGLQASVITGGTMAQFSPLNWQYTRTYAYPQQTTSNGLNAFATIVVGNATVRASYENILGQTWYTTSYAPMIARDLRFSFAWSFFD